MLTKILLCHQYTPRQKFREMELTHLALYAEIHLAHYDNQMAYDETDIILNVTKMLTSLQIHQT